MEPHASRSEAVPDTDTGNVTKDENEITMMTPVSVKGVDVLASQGDMT